MDNTNQIVEISDGRDASLLCQRLLDGLPEWFGNAKANAKYTQSAATMPGFIAIQNAADCGLMLLAKTSESTLDIHLLAIEKSAHRQGIGKMLINEARKVAHAKNFSFLTVKTLGLSSDYPPYAKTRQFYRAMGFEPLMEYTESGQRHPMLLMCQSVTG